MITVQTFIDQFEAIVPPELAESKDPVGLQIGSRHKELRKVMMTLDVRPSVVKEAIEQGVDLIVAKHPPIFRSISNLVTDGFQNKMYSDLLTHDIAVYVAHTNMDIVEDGLNDWFCEMLGLENTTYLTPTHTFNYESVSVKPEASSKDQILEYIKYTDIEVFEDSDALELIYPKTKHRYVKKMLSQCGIPHMDELKTVSLNHKIKQYGIGRVGTLPQAITLEACIEKIKLTFGKEHIILVTDRHDKMIQTIAICGGSGEKFYKDALKAGADLYITGDVYYHTAHDMIEEGLTVIDPGHYIESVCKQRYVEMFDEWNRLFDWQIECITSTIDTNPFKIV